MTNKLAITLVLFSTSAAAAGGLLSAGRLFVRNAWRTAPGAAAGVYLLLGVLSGVALTLLCAGVYRDALGWSETLSSTSLGLGPPILAHVAAWVGAPHKAWTIEGLALIGWPAVVALWVVLAFRVMPTPTRPATNKAAGAKGGVPAGPLQLSLLAVFLRRIRTAMASVLRQPRRYRRRARAWLSVITRRTLSRLDPWRLVTPAASDPEAARSGGPASATAFASAAVTRRRMAANGISKPAHGPVYIADPTRSQGSPNAGKYGRSYLSRTRQIEIASRLDARMRRDGLHRDPLLSLPGLAARISVTPNHLSQVLNGYLGDSFFDYVNRRRVEDAVARIRTTDQPILTIALDVGFNSRSTFNAAVKKHTGRPPSAFRLKRPDDNVRIHPPGRGGV